MEEGSEWEGDIERERSTGGGYSTRRWEHRSYCASLTPSYIYLRLIDNYPHSSSISVSVSALQHRCMYMWAAGVPQDTARETRTVTPQDIRLSPTLEYNHNMCRSLSPLIWGRSTGLDNRSIRTARYRFVDIITHWARMSKSSAESQSRGGSVRDVRMASSNNTSPEGGSPPHQNRIRQVSVCVCEINETFSFLILSMCGRA